MQKMLHFNELFREDHLSFPVKKEKLFSWGKENPFLSCKTGNMNINVFFWKTIISKHLEKKDGFWCSIVQFHQK